MRDIRRQFGEATTGAQNGVFSRPVLRVVQILQGRPDAIIENVQDTYGSAFCRRVSRAAPSTAMLAASDRSVATTIGDRAPAGDVDIDDACDCMVSSLVV